MDREEKISLDRLTLALDRVSQAMEHLAEGLAETLRPLRELTPDSKTIYKSEEDTDAQTG